MSPIIVGHRGVSGRFPENTRVSIEAAIQLGLKWIEVDVQPTKDNVLVVCHDHTVNRCSNGDGRVDAHTLAELQTLDFGAWFSSEFRGEPIMTLETLLHLASVHGVNLNIEVKIDQQDTAAVTQQLKTMLDKGPLEPDAIVLSSFNHDIIRQLHQHCPGYRLAVLSDRLRKKDWQLLEEVNAFGCNLKFRWVTQKQVRMLQNHGYQVWCFTVNNPRKLKHFSMLDGIFSDYPERFLKEQ